MTGKYHVLLALAGKFRFIVHAIVVLPLWKAVQFYGQPAGLS
jgi:hypothetical protein